MGNGGKRIAEIRAELGWSQAKFAEKLHVTRETVSRWERGQTSPKYDYVNAAEKLLARHSKRAVI